jgi:hypothetical protein
METKVEAKWNEKLELNLSEKKKYKFFLFSLRCEFEEKLSQEKRQNY